ncbi:MAG: RdgB/HAM1 family non-canonical purine NTP pyrophosphatase [Planctomycetota bacterium]|jgi:XTP/dITP diphosphohydrolase
MTRPLLFATSNPHKIDEVRAILAPLGIDVEGLDALDEIPPEPEEDGATFAANARLKAVYYARRTGRACLADDSGLEVDALGGEPGVRSARYAGVGATRPERDAANNRLLLERLRDVPAPRRTARFVCAMCLADPDGRVVAETRGTFDGVIAETPAGANGFGYDPLLHLADAGCTSAELAPEAKNARSHRGAAARAMAERLEGSSEGCDP